MPYKNIEERKEHDRLYRLKNRDRKNKTLREWRIKKYHSDTEWREKTLSQARTWRAAHKYQLK